MMSVETPWPDAVVPPSDERLEELATGNRQYGLRDNFQSRLDSTARTRLAGNIANAVQVRTETLTHLMMALFAEALAPRSPVVPTSHTRWRGRPGGA